MSTEVFAQAEALRATDPNQAISLYTMILESTIEGSWC